MPAACGLRDRLLAGACGTEFLLVPLVGAAAGVFSFAIVVEAGVAGLFARTDCGCATGVVVNDCVGRLSAAVACGLALIDPD